jgi:hypothetical protein
MQPKTQIFNIKIYLIWQMILVMAIGLGLMCLLLVFVMENGFVDRHSSWIEHVFKGIAVVFIFISFVLTEKWMSINVQLSIQPNGLEIIYPENRSPFQPANKFIFWNEIDYWKRQEEHFSSHSFALPEFKLKLTNGEKVNLYIALSKHDYLDFLPLFEEKIKEVNEKNSNVCKIFDKTNDTKSKSAFWLFFSIGTLFIGFSIWMFFAKEIGKLRSQDISDLKFILIFAGVTAYFFAFAFTKDFKNKSEQP